MIYALPFMVLDLEKKHHTSFNSSASTHFVVFKLSYRLGEGNLLSLSTDIIWQGVSSFGCVAREDGVLLWMYFWKCGF